jgi:hypothetical protein
MSAFPYNPIKEIHGYNIKGLEEQCGVIPNRVLRATVFGGSRDNIKKITKLFYQQVKISLDLGYIGTEEAIYTILTYLDKSEIEFLLMENGDINNFLKTTLCLR